MYFNVNENALYRYRKWRVTILHENICSDPHSITGFGRTLNVSAQEASQKQGISSFFTIILHFRTLKRDFGHDKKVTKVQKWPGRGASGKKESTLLKSFPGSVQHRTFSRGMKRLHKMSKNPRINHRMPTDCTSKQK